MTRWAWEAAKIKMASRDGNGCLAELDAHDALDPNHKSTDPKVLQSQTRAQCRQGSGKHLEYSPEPKRPAEIDQASLKKSRVGN